MICKSKYILKALCQCTVKKTTFGQNKRYKKCPHFCLASSNSNSQFLYKLNHFITNFISLKLCVRFSIFVSLLFLLKFLFCSTKIMNSLTLKRCNSFQNKNKKTHAHFCSQITDFKVAKEVWKFSYICMRWSSPKSDLQMNF